MTNSMNSMGTKVPGGIEQVIPKHRAHGALERTVADAALYKKAKEYFWYLDGSTNPEFTGNLLTDALPRTPEEWRLRMLAAFAKNSIPRLMEILRARMTNRRKPAPLGFGPYEKAPAQEVRAVSDLMLYLLNRTFGNINDPEVLRQVGKAHDLFAWGALHTESHPAIPTPEMSPDSANVVLFAEFAHLAIECGVDKEAWERLLPIMTRVTAVYFSAHQKAGEGTRWAPKPFDNYKSLPQRFPDDGEFWKHVASLEKEIACANGDCSALGDYLRSWLDRMVA